MMIHIIVKSTQETETNAIDFSKHLKMKITCQRGDVMEVERHLAMWIEELYQYRIPISLALLQEKAMSLYEAEMEEFEEEVAPKVKQFDA
jgi:hypothetical protein